MELNREQIIKALECISNTEDVLCEGCAYKKYDGLACHRIGAKNALALIKEQEEQIFKLENRLKECENGCEGTVFLDRCKLHDAEEKVRELTQANEQLSESYDHLEKTKDELIAERSRLILKCQEAEKINKEKCTLEYTLLGVMHSVDKWLDGAELEQDEVNRAITMREKTLQIVEKLTEENERLQGLVKEVQEYNESWVKDNGRLRGILLEFTDIVHKWGNKNGYDTSEISLVPILNEESAIKKQIEADTLQKYKSAIIEYYSKPKYQPTREHPIKHTQIKRLFAVLDQIAKEIADE